VRRVRLPKRKKNISKYSTPTSQKTLMEMKDIVSEADNRGDTKKVVVI